MTMLLRRSILTFLTFTLCIMVTACSDVPAPYRIANTTDPRYEDEDVRFRTTYYLRIFDLCPIGTANTDGINYQSRLANWVTKTKGAYTIYRDSLYRFRMTGQARALFSNVRFESGTLRAHQLDPFGQTIEFNGTSGRFSAPASTQAANIPSSGNSKPPSPPGISEAPTSNTEKSDAQSCPNGDPMKPEFFLLGPEGTKHLDPDERLVMAMSSDARPLVSALQFLSENLTQQSTEATLLFRFEYDRQHATRAKDIVGTEPDTDKTEPTQQDVLARIDRVLNLFQPFGGDTSSASLGMSVKGQR
ncbi:MAG TPA: hypothetical protein VJ746_02095 [Nitrospira sp.]|nr:hypothetical protein [Nitrospira sp.]